MQRLSQTVWFSILFLTACGRPDFKTDLNPAGPPQVALINVSIDPTQGSGEAATYCGATVARHEGYCPDEGPAAEVQVGAVNGLYVRVAFDELLDPAIEVLDLEAGTGSIAAAHPVSIRCGNTELSYEGFYDPAGSHLTEPPGPALIIEPTDLIAGGVGCTVEVLESVKDKDGNPVALGARGPFSFGLAPLGIITEEPADMAEGIDSTVTVAVVFNNLIDETTLAGRVHISDANGEVAVTGALDPESPDVVLIAPDGGPLADGTTYTVTIDAGISDVRGGIFAPEGGTYSFSFTTGS